MNHNFETIMSFPPIFWVGIGMLALATVILWVITPSPPKE